MNWMPKVNPNRMDDDELKEYAETAPDQRLREYAAALMKLRTTLATGSKAVASAQQSLCDSLYNSLPNDMKW